MIPISSDPIKMLMLLGVLKALNNAEPPDSLWLSTYSTTMSKTIFSMIVLCVCILLNMYYRVCLHTLFL